MTNQISYQKKNDDIECVHYKNWTKAYPPHTHAEHLTLGIVEDGSVCIVMEGKSKIYGAGDEFQIPPDVLHEIKPVDDNGYSMLVPVDFVKVNLAFRQTKTSTVEFFKKFFTHIVTS